MEIFYDYYLMSVVVFVCFITMATVSGRKVPRGFSISALIVASLISLLIIVFTINP